MAVLISALPSTKKPPHCCEDSCFWVCLRYQVAPLRCLSILGSGKVKKKMINLKHYEIEKFSCRIDVNTFTSFVYVDGTNLMSWCVIC